MQVSQKPEDFTPPDASAVYVRFLNLLDAIRAEPDFPSLDPLESSLLNALAQRWLAGKTITVLETIGSGVEGASPSTIHRRLKALSAHGLVKFQPDAQDKRVKYIASTPLAMAYLRRLGQCLVSCSQAASATPSPSLAAIDCQVDHQSA